MCPTSINRAGEASEREGNRQTAYASVPFGKRRGGMILSSKVQKHPQSHTARPRRIAVFHPDGDGERRGRQSGGSLPSLP